MNNQATPFDIEAEDVSQTAWEDTVSVIYDDAFDSCGGGISSGCEPSCTHHY